LTGKPWRATTPGNALLNFLYALLESEMTVALLAVGLHSGIGIFHADIDSRSSLALDVIEAVRPYVDCWLLAYLASSVFANRDFTELSDGEVRITHPLNSHLAHTAVLWRKACEPVAEWLAQALGRSSGTGAVLTADDRMISVSRHTPARLVEQSHSHRWRRRCRPSSRRRELGFLHFVARHGLTKIRSRVLALSAAEHSLPAGASSATTGAPPPIIMRHRGKPSSSRPRSVMPILSIRKQQRSPSGRRRPGMPSGALNGALD